MWQHKLAGKRGNNGFIAFIKEKKWVYQKQGFLLLKVAMRQERHVCDHVKKSSCLHGIRCLAKTRNLNSRGHSVMKLSVGGTQSLNATCKLLIAEKTFYIFVNEKNF